MGLSRRLQADLSIIGLSAIWGCTFVVSKRALTDISPLLFITVRFVAASLPLWFLVPRGALQDSAGAVRWSAVRGGSLTGLFLFAGFACQTIGIQYTSPARSAFITSMYVIFTPILSMTLGLRRPSITSFTGAALAVTGLYFLTGAGSAGLGFGYGETLTVFAALAFSAHLLAIDHYTRRHDKRAIAFLQVGAVAVLALGPTLFVEQVRFVPTPTLFGALAITSILATAVAFFVISIVQSWTTPTRAAIIFAAEPVFAALTSWIVEGEVLTGVAMFGALLILCGVLTAELGPLARRQPEAAT